MVSNADIAYCDDMQIEDLALTKLESHDNMTVVVFHAYVILYTGRIADVNPFTPGYNSMQVPIMYAAFHYY